MDATVTVSEIAAMFHCFEEHGTSRDKKRKRVPSSRALMLSQSKCPPLVHKQAGVDREEKGIRMYCQALRPRVCVRDDKNVTAVVRFENHAFCVCGRADAICDDVIVEHKYRTRGLLQYVPLHERVQCHLYMVLYDLRSSHLVETFGEQMLIHRVDFSTALWQRVLRRLSETRPPAPTQVRDIGEAQRSACAVTAGNAAAQ